MAKATGKLSTNTPSDDQGGAGDMAGPAAVSFLEEASRTAKEDLRDRYPLLASAFERLSKTVSSDFDGRFVIRISAKKDGFRRGGIEHSSTQDHDADKFTADQVEAILGEPLLHVELVAVS